MEFYKSPNETSINTKTMNLYEYKAVRLMELLHFH